MKPIDAVAVIATVAALGWVAVELAKNRGNPRPGPATVPSGYAGINIGTGANEPAIYEGQPVGGLGY